MLKLIIEDDEGRKTVVPFVRDEITIGRQEGNTVRLLERNVSRRHARLSRQNGQIHIEDLGSYNGIRVNGDRVAGRVTVNDGDLIQIGDYGLELQAEQPSAQPTVPFVTESTSATPPPPEGLATVRGLPLIPEAPAPAPATRERRQENTEAEPAARSAAAARAVAAEVANDTDVSEMPEAEDVDPADAPRLVVLNTELAGRTFVCSKTSLTIGRASDADFSLDHRSLSKAHCRMLREAGGEWRLVDLASANGLVVNGETYAHVTLRPRDVIELGHVQLQFFGPGDRVTEENVVDAAVRIGPSRGPLFAVLGTTAVIVLGLGGYAVWKSRGPNESRTEEVAGRPPATGEGRSAAQTKGLVEREIEHKLERAQEAMQALDWDTATKLLNGCQVDGALTPRALALLGRIDAERANQTSLEEAGRLLKAGDEAGAKRAIEAASHTVLLQAQLEELTAALASRHGAPGVALAPKLRRAPVPPVAPGPSRGRADEAEALYREAQELLRGKQLDAAAAKLDQCVRGAPMYYPCHKLSGSVQARISQRDGDGVAYERARKAYERYLELAPPNDPDVAKVKTILEQANQSP